MSAARVLIVDPASEILTRHSGLLKDAEAGVVAETVATIAEALARVAKAGYDAVLCRVDRPEEVSLVVRLRKAAPRVAIVAVTPGPNPALEDLARESGADDIQPDLGEAESVGRKAARRIERLIARTRSTRSRSRELRAQTRELVAEHRRIVTRNRIFSQQRIGAVAEGLSRFLPLLAEDSADQVVLMRRAFMKASLPFPLPVMKDGEEAIDYLAGEGMFGNRVLYPLPTLAILDIRMPRKSGLEVLFWIRSRAEFAALPVYMLTSSTLEFEQAMSIGATDYFVKPVSFDGLIDVIRNMTVRWWFYEQARAYTFRPR